MVSSRRFFVAVATFALVAAAQSQTVVTWANLGTDFTLGANWTGGVAPSPTGNFATPNIAELGTASPSFQPVLNSNFGVDELRFAAGAGSFTLSGTGTLNVGVVGIVNQSTAPQTIAVPLAFSTSGPSIVNEGTLTISGSINNSVGPLGLQITNNGTMTLSGSLANNGTLGVSLAGTGVNSTVSGVISGAGALTKSGTGTWALSGANTYTGVTTISAGTILVSSVANGGSASSIGASSNAAANVVLNGGTAQFYYTGAAGTTDRLFTLGTGGGALVASGTGPINFSNTGAIALAGTNTSRTLRLDGTNTGANLLGPSLADNGTGVTSLQKGGTGTWVLGGANTYSGGTNLNTGRLADAAAGAFSPNSTVRVASGATLAVGFNETIAGLTDSSGAGGAVTLAGGTTLTLRNGGVFSGVISGTGGVALASGFQTLNGVNTYTGGTTINGGRLQLRGSGSLAGNGPVVINTTNAAASATLDTGDGSTSIGALTFGGTGAATNGFNQVVIGWTGNLLLQGDVTYNATNNPGAAQIYGGTLSLSGTRTFNIADSTSSDAELVIYASISGGNLTKTGAGALALAGFNTFGDLTVSGGAVYIGSDFSSGSGTITLQNGTKLASFYSQTSIANPVVLGNNVTLGGENIYGESVLSLGGTTTLLNNVSTVHLAGGGFTQVANLNGPASTAVTFDGGGRIVLTGTTGSNITSITANGAGVVFLSAASVPNALSLAAVNRGYVGVAGSTFGVALASPLTLMSRIASPAAFDGTFGFDTDKFNNMGPHVFTQALNFSAFTHPNFTIGSSSVAVLTGPITPPTTGYAFGNGGGVLFLQSNLTAPRSVSVSSATVDGGLLAVLRGNNTFTGNVSIADAGVLLDSAAALPAGRTVTMGGTASYFGATEAFKPAASFVSFAASNLTFGSGAVLGFDSHSVINHELSGHRDEGQPPVRTVTDTIDLSGFGAIALGTATGVSFAGPIVAPGHGVLSLIPLADSVLTISSVLSAANIGSIVIGSPDFGEHGVVELNGANTYTGGTTLKTGVLAVGNNAALGSGPLTVASTAMPMLASGSAAGVTISNAITLNSDLTVGRWDFDSSQGFATAQAKQITLSGPLTGSGGLQITYGRTTLTGANTYTGSTRVVGGTLVFGAASAIPASGTVAADFGSYVGVGFNSFTNGLQTDFINRLDRHATSGTIGFDTLSGATQTFSGDINLADPDGTGPVTSFNFGVKLGSSTSARLTGTITPAQSTQYNFGGGGGVLDVASSLVDAASGARGVNVDSPLTPSTLRLSSTANSYTGSTVVTNSAVVFAAGARPPSTNFVMNYAGYIGTEETGAANMASFLGQFPTWLDTGVIGFDAASAAGSYTISSNLDLSRFNSTFAQFAVGTTTNLVFGTGASITLPATASEYRFAGYKGGLVQVDIPLANGAAARGVVVGSQDSPPTQGDAAGKLSVVRLTAANTYSGGTTLYAGELQLGNALALGTGPLTVAPNYFGAEAPPQLSTLVNGITLANAVKLGSDLDVSVNSSLTLAGVITDGDSSAGELYKLGVGGLTLSGHNTFTGGIYIREGAITFTQPDSVGLGPLQFGVTTSTIPSATFLTSSTVNGIYGDSSVHQINLGSGTTLTVNQMFDSQYLGTFNGSNATLVFQNTTGSAVRLRLAGASTGFSGSTTIGSSVAVVAATNNVFGPASNAVTLNGGKLALDAAVTLANPLTLTNGKLGGIGTFRAPAGSSGYEIKSGVVLAPGLGGPGQLAFDGTLLGTSAVLTLASGGAYHWQVTDVTNAATGWDLVAVTGTVNITATSVAPFNFKLLTVASEGSMGLASNFDPGANYSWPVLSASSITGFTSPSQFAVDPTGFLNGTAIGSFNFTLNPDGTKLLLNFTPVPEPSTWVLMGTGALALLRGLRRRRS